ncbi:ankyrin repeat-containing domain protein [Hyaloscypha sp. PMI_1271]|nr:ankyrin repeat-containing domain protein [Hyaloscypha sp. PMI_1271]
MMIGMIFNDKQGKSRVETGQYLIMNARGGRLLREISWQHAIKQDDHLSMSMILNELDAKDGICPFPSCKASLSGVQVKNGGQTCLECGRWAVLTPRKSTPSGPTNRSSGNLFDDESMSGWDATSDRDSKEKLFEQKLREDSEEDKEDIEVYRQVHVQTTTTLPIYSISAGIYPPNADKTPLQFAVQNHDKEMIKCLLGGKNDVNAVFGIIQHTPLQIACRDGEKEIVHLLLQSGADANAPPAKESGATALQFAAIKGSLEIVYHLLEYGADVNAPAAEVYGRTALEGAAEHGRVDVVQLLLTAGASVVVDGQTQYENAVKRASENGHYAVRRLLESYHG